MSRVEIKQAMIAKEVLNTTDEEVLDQLKMVLDRPRGEWWANLPAKVRRDVEESLAQADRGETVSHAEAMKQVQAWRKR
jgi:predicted transcriptional regulator